MVARAERQPKPATVDQPRSRRRRPGTRRFRWATAVEIALLTLAAVIVAFPLFFMITSGLKHEVDIFSTDLSKVVNFAPTLDNFRDVFSTTSEGLDLYQNFLNSVIVAGGATLLATGLGVPAAWAYSRLKPRDQNTSSFSSSRRE